MITLHAVSKIRITPQFGWIPDPPDTENKDLHFAVTPMASGSLGTVKDEMDNADYFKPISDQLGYPSCAANASADAWEAQTISDKVDKGVSLVQAISTTPDFSRMFLWWNGRNEMYPNQASNAAAGCYNRLMFDVIARHGVCPEELWPYDGALLGGLPRPVVRPSIKAYRAAFPNMCGAFYCITETENARGNLIRQALGARHNVVFGTVLGSEFPGYKEKVLYRPTGTVIGRHAMVICGWSRLLDAYKVRNSWTMYWGQQGYCWMSRDYIENYPQTSGLWVATKGVL
jgi:C1A family cysteine protease